MEDSIKKTVQDGAMAAAIALFTDSVNPLQAGSEFVAQIKARKRLLGEAPYAGRPLFEMMRSEEIDAKPEIRGEDQDTQTYSLTLLELARDAVLEHYGEEDAKLYGRFIVEVTIEVARSAGGGFLGTDEDYSDEERAYVAQIEELFGLR